MKFKQYKNTLSSPQFKPIKRDELNKMVINQSDDDKVRAKVVNSLQRMLVGIVANERTNNNYLLMDYVQVGNEAILESMDRYTNDKIDFAYYAFVSIKNKIASYKRFVQNTVKSAHVNNERVYPEMTSVDGIDQEDEEYDELDPYALDEIILSAPLKDVKKQMLCYYFGINGEEPHTFKQTAEHFGYSSTQSASYAIHSALHKLRTNPEITKKLKELTR